LTGIGEIDFKRHGLEMFKTEDGIAVTWGTNEIAIVPMTNVKFYVFEAEKESKDDGNVRNKPANTANKKT